MSATRFPTGQGAVIRGTWKYDDPPRQRMFTRVGKKKWSLVRDEFHTEPTPIDITNEDNITPTAVLSEGFNEPVSEWTIAETIERAKRMAAMSDSPANTPEVSQAAATISSAYSMLAIAKSAKGVDVLARRLDRAEAVIETLTAERANLQSQLDNALNRKPNNDQGEPA